MCMWMYEKYAVLFLTKCPLQCLINTMYFPKPTICQKTIQIYSHVHNILRYNRVQFSVGLLYSISFLESCRRPPKVVHHISRHFYNILLKCIRTHTYILVRGWSRHKFRKECIFISEALPSANPPTREAARLYYMFN